MDIHVLYFEDLGDTSVVSECSLGVNIVTVNIIKNSHPK